MYFIKGHDRGQTYFTTLDNRVSADYRVSHTLYMCALNAKETNGACKELFDRLAAKGKKKT